MSRIQMLQIATLAAGLTLAAPSLAKAPAPALGQPKKFETDCFEVKLPSSMVPFRRKKADAARPYLGAWGYRTANARIKVFFRCSAYKPGPFGQALGNNLKNLLRKVAGWTQVSRAVVKDGARNVATVVGKAFMKVLDPKTKKSVAQEHVITRIFRRYPDTKIQVAITVSATQARAADIERVVQMIVDSFDPIDLKEKAKLEAQAGKKK